MSLELQRFTSILSELSEHGEARSRRALESLVSERMRGSPGAGDIRLLLFARALSRRLSPERMDALDLYLRHAVSRLQRFDLPGHALPTVGMAAYIANALLCHHLAGEEEAVLLDIGPGPGRQAVDLVRWLGRREDRPRRLTVVAVEPDAVSLRAAEHNLLEASQAYGIELHVVGLASRVEDLGPESWALVASLPGALVVHAAFSLHHVHGHRLGEELRDTVLRRVRMLEPKALVLVEPSVDHHVADLEQRFRNCWHYFGRMFDLVDRLALDARDRDALKAFFGREIEDILGSTEACRSKRHEPVSHWWRRLERTGFERAVVPGSVVPGSHPLVRAHHHPGYVGLDYEGETLLAVLCATPARASRR